MDIGPRSRRPARSQPTLVAARRPPEEQCVKVLDYARSSLMFRIDTEIKPPITASHKPPFPLNNARILLESSCWITDERDGRTRRFVHGASCKRERVGGERDI